MFVRQTIYVMMVVIVFATASAQDAGKRPSSLPITSAYLGFDRNIYPGDANLKALHQTFSYTGYWLNNPPSEKTNTWAGHRAVVESAGFGFLVLFNGRMYGELKSVAHAKKGGNSDARAAAAAARREGFPAHTIILLD